jgi:hypothetical protein
MVKKDIRWGGLLQCDDMGMGKTVQTLAFLARRPLWPTLILAPNELLVRQWLSEARKFLPAANCLACKTVPEFNRMKSKELQKYHLVIVPHSALQPKPMEEVRHLLLTHELHCIQYLPSSSSRKQLGNGLFMMKSNYCAPLRPIFTVLHCVCLKATLVCHE